MKILLIRPWPFLLDVEKNTYNIQEAGLAKALTRRGHPTDILFWTDGEEHTVNIPVEGSEPVRVFYRRGIAALKNAWFLHIDQLAQSYDILQSAEYNQMFSWYLAGRYPKKTVIYHGPYYSAFNRNYNRMCAVFDVLFTGRYRKKNTPFLVKSNLAGRFLREKGIADEQIAVVGVGIDAQRLSGAEGQPSDIERQMRAQEKGLKLLYIGRVEPRRDSFFLIEVLKEVRKRDQDACFYWIGSGEAAYTEQVRARIAEAGLERAIVWVDALPQNQMKGVYDQADFFLLPTEYEIFGMVMLEAMFFGKLVLTTKNGGSDMLIRSGENGVVLSKEDAGRWAEAMLEIAADSNKRERMQQNAHQTVSSTYTWDALAERFLRVYRKVST